MYFLLTHYQVLKILNRFSFQSSAAFPKNYLHFLKDIVVNFKIIHFTTDRDKSFNFCIPDCKECFISSNS